MSAVPLPPQLKVRIIRGPEVLQAAARVCFRFPDMIPTRQTGFRDFDAVTRSRNSHALVVSQIEGT